MAKIYIILSRSHTLFARAIRVVSKKYYNHTSIAFDASLDTFYSFGRRNPRKVFPAGFITEGVHRGFFGIFPKTELCVLEYEISEEDLQLVKKRLQPFIDNPIKHRYDAFHVPVMAFGIKYKPVDDYVCSVFAAHLLQGIFDFEKDISLVYPEDFYKFNPKIIYKGTAGDYNYEKQSV